MKLADFFLVSHNCEEFTALRRMVPCHYCSEMSEERMIYGRTKRLRSTR